MLEELLNHRALGSETEGIYLLDVGGEDGARDVVEALVGKDHSDDTVPKPGLGEARLVGQGRENGPDAVGDEHTGCRRDEHASTIESIDQQAARTGAEEGPDLRASIDDELRLAVCDADTPEDEGEVVRDETIARPLLHETQECHEHETASISRGAKEVQPL